jgi:membrane protein DedA with SNARE-associated domain
MREHQRYPQSGRRPYTSANMDKIDSLIEHFGYLFVFFGVMLGCSGIPFPGATILLAAGIMVQQGYLELGDAIVFGILGAIVGGQVGYWVGHKRGRPFVLKWGGYVRLTPERLDRVERFFVRYGGKAVFVSRFVSIFRVLGAPVAGISRMHRGTFLFYNVLGGTVWATAVVLIGYFFGQSWSETRHWSGRAPLLLALLIAVAFGLFLAHRWWRALHRG